MICELCGRELYYTGKKVDTEDGTYFLRLYEMLEISERVFKADFFKILISDAENFKEVLKGLIKDRAEALYLKEILNQDMSQKYQVPYDQITLVGRDIYMHVN